MFIHCFVRRNIKDNGDVFSGHEGYMYIFNFSDSHNVYPKGKYIVFFTEAEINNPQNELKSGIDILGALNGIF